MRWLISLALAWSVTAGPAAAAEARSHFMWVLHDKGKTIRIVGYPDWVPPDVSPLNLPAAMAVRKAGQIYTDDFGTPSAGDIMRLASLMACRAPLSDRLPTELLTKVRALSVKAGIDFEELEPGCGWYAVVRIEDKLRSVQGYSEADIAEVVASLMELGSNQTELVELDDLLPMIQTVKPEDDAELLSGLVSDLNHLEEFASGTYKAWIDGDEAAFLEGARLQTETDLVNIRLYDLLNNLLAARIAKIARFSSSDDAVVAIKATSLLGEGGVLTRLKKKGYSIYKVGG